MELTGFGLKTLLKLLDKKLDLFSLINICLNLVKNLEILHDNGIINQHP